MIIVIMALFPWPALLCSSYSFGVCSKAINDMPIVHDWETGQSVVLRHASFQVQLQRPSHGNAVRH